MQALANIFKAYDIRGKVGAELNPEVARLVGQAFACWLPESGPVAVGRDMRPDSKDLAGALIDGLRDQGRDVWDIGEVTSDMIYFAVGHNGLAGGAVVTASHNPGEYNGIKFCRDEAQGVAENTGLLEVRELAEANRFKTSINRGKVSENDVSEKWVQHILSFIDPAKLKPLKITVDAGNGMAGKIFPKLEPYLPFEVEDLFFELDGTFPNHIANPLLAENLVDIQAAMKKNGSVAGVAFDGDGDRAVLLDETGEPLSGTVLSALLSDYFLKLQPGATILLNAICGQAAVDTVEKAGGEVIRTRVGHSFIKNDMRTYDAIFAGEHSGHYYFRDNYRADSGLIAAVVGLFVLSQSNKKLSELVRPYREAYVQISETNFEVDDKEAMLKAIAEDFKSAEIDTLDGLTVHTDKGWFNVRPSNTEPLLRLNAEAKTQAGLDEMVKEVKKVLTERPS